MINRTPNTRLDGDGKGDWKVPWGGTTLHIKYATEHFLVLGATGSGKTILINILMRDVLPELRQNRSRALVYDAKQDVIPVLHEIGLGERCKILHPFDQRSYAWDMAKDIVDPISARQLASILVPDEDEPAGGGNSGFFTNAVRDLLTGVFLVFINCATKGQWTFRDVVLAMLYPQCLSRILAMNRPQGQEPFHLPERLRQSYLAAEKGGVGADPRTASNIRSTINAKLSIYEPIAAAWHQAWKQHRTFCLSEWLRSDDILVLGNDEASRTALDAVNRALFKRMTELILAKPEACREERERGRELTWVFFDEVREAGRLDGLSRLLTKGRSKGVAVVLGFQDIEGLRDVYGSEVANELAGQCHNVVILKLNSPSTAQWAADLFGKQLETFDLPSMHVGATGPSSGTAQQQQERARVYTGELLYLPSASRTHGLCGFQRWKTQPLSEWKQVPQTAQKRWQRHIDDGTAFALDWAALDLKDTDSPQATDEVRLSYWPRDAADQYLEAWTPQEWTERLGFDGKLFPSLDPADRVFESTAAEELTMQVMPPEDGIRILDIEPL